MEECHQVLTNQVVLVNPEGHRIMPDVRKPLLLRGPPALSISKLKATHYLDFRLEELVFSLYIESEHEYDISAAYGVSHWWFKRKEFYITRHDCPSNCSKVRSHMWILSVISLKTYVRYGYAFLKEIALRRANYKEYKISEADVKNLHRMILRICIYCIFKSTCESYQTKLNLTQLDWDESDFLFKEDYTIVNKPRAIMEKLDHMVKDFRLFKYNLGMTTRIWSEDDRRRSKEFMEVIEHKLKLRTIFRSLESFVGGRLRDVDYILIQRTK
uniref:Uncharacterized protein n=1 Tax=Tanacetum cinerariifolium TaxID=118510 RepID=A0A6L2J6B2_TANCI|nr:hypothetical protein [Tanacetum cinerariifolium]